MASTSSYASLPSMCALTTSPRSHPIIASSHRQRKHAFADLKLHRHCAWGLCRLSFGTKDQLKEHIRRHVLEARPIPRPRPEGSEISESYLPPRIVQAASSPPPIGNTSGAETTTEESQSSVNRAPAYGLDELPAPVMSAPPASIHSQYTQSMSIQESQDAPSPPQADEPFGLHFSQMQDVQFTQV